MDEASRHHRYRRHRCCRLAGRLTVLACVHAENNWISSRTLALSKRNFCAFETKSVHGPSCLMALLPITCNGKCIHAEVIATLPGITFCFVTAIAGSDLFHSQLSQFTVLLDTK
jgi:hypothetical protein